MLLSLISMQKYIGVFDLIIIGLLLVFLAIGILVGFFRIALKVANFVFGFFFSAVFASKFATFLGVFIRKPIYKHFYAKVGASKAMSSITEGMTANEALADVLKNYGLQKSIANYIAKNFKFKEADDVRHAICSAMASGITRFILIIISFFVLWIGLSVLFFFVRKFIVDLRENTGFKVFDGILGAILAIFLWFIFTEIMMFVVSLSSVNNSVALFVGRDMRLSTYRGFGLARWFYNKNLLKAFWDMIF